MPCPTFLKIENSENRSIEVIEFQAKESKEVMSFLASKIDTAQLKEQFSFSGLWYGSPNLTSYDTLYNYNLPFLKGKRYRILQGQNTNFTHKGSFSRYAIDFKMKIGQTVCAIREGIVVKVTQKYSKGGRNKKYKPYANMVIIYHRDGTFAQYVHLKKNGSLVQVGNTVKKGQPIGYSGNTGMSTEPHLHFALYKPTKKGLVSIPFILDSIPTKRYKKGKYANNR